jgi:hypothetical protein
MELVNYLYGWYTNEEHTTWYRQQEAEAAALLAAQAIEPTPEPKKRTRKTSTK